MYDYKTCIFIVLSVLALTIVFVLASKGKFKGKGEDANNAQDTYSGDDTSDTDIASDESEFKGTDERKYDKKIVRPFLNTIHNNAVLELANRKDGKIIISEYFGLLFDKIGNPYDKLTISQDVRLYLINHQYNKEAIKRLATIILCHLRIPFNYFEVELGVNKEETTAGLHSRQNGRLRIYVSLHDYNTVDQVIAIVCHECTHEYMFINNIQLPSEKENERLTDAAAVYLGLGNLLYKGYLPTYENTRNPAVTVKHTIGYLNPNEIIDLIRLIPYAKEEYKIKRNEELEQECLAKEEQKKKKAEELERELLKQQKLDEIINHSPERLKSLQNKIILLNEIFNRYKEIYRLFISARVPLPQNEDLNVLSRCIDDNDFKKMENEIKKISDVIVANDKYSEKGYKKLANDLDQLCTELTLRNAVIGKYL